MTEEQHPAAVREHRPRVSVIMNCYNGAAFLRDAIASVQAQTMPDWEIIFWDNASTDDSASIAQSYGDPRLRYFRAEVNRPLGAARNEALARATGDFIAFLDTDDVWYADKLAAQVAYFADHPECDFVYSNVLLFGEGSRHKLFKRARSYYLPQPVGRVFKRFLTRYPVNLQTVMIRHAALREIDERFDPSLQVMEEYDLFMRLLYDRRVGYLHRVLVAYRLHPRQDSRTKLERYAIESEYIVGKLKRRFPDSMRECRREYEMLTGKTAYYHARAAVRDGNQPMARELLRPYRWLAWRFFVLDMMLFLPGNAFTRLHKLAGRYY